MSEVRIEYNGDDITPFVVVSDCSFTSRTDGNVGDAFVRVKDAGRTFAPGYFHAGGRLVLVIDGLSEWSGWVMSASRVYAFSVDKTENPMATPRFWVLNGSDLNLLFQRRYLYRLVDPADPAGFPYLPAGTSDLVVFQTYFDNYVDLTNTPLSLPLDQGIQPIGSPGNEAEFIIASVGEPLASLFQDVCEITGGVFYISPEGILTYCDDSVLTAPFVLSDRPTGAQVGYREMEIRSTADAMANDALVWGAGLGSAKPVFQRYVNQAAVGVHGLFQWGDLYAGAWKDATVLRRAQTYVEGSPLHRRGHKDDQYEITCTVFVPGFQAGMVVNFNSETYGYQDNVPIRQARITFPVSSIPSQFANIASPRWDLTMSHVVDTAFAKHDPWDHNPRNLGNHPGWVDIDTWDNRITCDTTVFGIASSGNTWVPLNQGGA